MRTQLLDMCEHAILWEGITEFHHRHVAYPEDVTIATHPALGLCVISHYALDGLVCWMTHGPISVFPLETSASSRI